MHHTYRNDLSKQSAFVRSLLASQEWNKISGDSESLQNFITILQEPTFPEKRVLFIKNLQILHCIIRRVKKFSKSVCVLQQTQVAENSNSSNSEVELVHPAHEAVCPLLPVVLRLVKTIHSLLDDPHLASLVELSDQEKSHILGIHFSDGAQTVIGEPLPASVGSNDIEKPHTEKLKVCYACVYIFTMY